MAHLMVRPTSWERERKVKTMIVHFGNPLALGCNVWLFCSSPFAMYKLYRIGEANAMPTSFYHVLLCLILKMISAIDI